jgi:hypothetical protein
MRLPVVFSAMMDSDIGFVDSRCRGSNPHPSPRIYIRITGKAKKKGTASNSGISSDIYLIFHLSKRFYVQNHAATKLYTSGSSSLW